MRINIGKHLPLVRDGDSGTSIYDSDASDSIALGVRRDWSLHIFRSYHIISYLILLYCTAQCSTALTVMEQSYLTAGGMGTRSGAKGPGKTGQDRTGEELSPSGERKEHGRAGWRLSPHFLPCPLLRLSTSSSSSSSPISCDQRCSAAK